MRDIDIEGSAHVTDGRSVAGIELWNGSKLLTISLGRLSPGKCLGGGRVVQAVGVVHAANHGHVMHDLGRVG